MSWGAFVGFCTENLWHLDNETRDNSLFVISEEILT